MNSNDSSYNEVFISYSRKDRDFAQKIVNAIYASGVDNIWVDWEDIEFSENWWERIKAGIESAHNFLFLMTPDSLKSQPCYDEIEHAVNSGKRIIPVLHMDIKDAEDHNRMHPAIAQHHWLNFRETDDFDASLKILLKTIETDLAHTRFHTRLLTRAKEWAKAGRDDGHALATAELKEAVDWLNAAEKKKKTPYPVDLQREFVDASRRYHRRRQQIVLSFTFISLIIAGLAILSVFLFQDSQHNLALVQERGTDVARQATIADFNAQTAIVAANSNSTQVVIANTAQADAANNALTAEAALATSDVLRGTAESESVVYGGLAISALQTAQVRGTQVQNEAERANQNAVAAQTSAAKAEENANQAELNAVEAKDNARQAELNAATATIALGYAENSLATSEASESLARSQTLALNAEQALKLGDTDSAIMLSLEANRIDPMLIQAQNAIYRAADISPYFVVGDAYLASFSPDGSKILTVNNDEFVIYLWDLATRTLLHRLEGHDGRINDAVFSNDGKYIISASSDTSIIVWDVETGQQVYRRIASDITVWDIALNPVASQFVSVGDFNKEAVAAGSNPLTHNSMILWDLATGEELRRFPRRELPDTRAQFRYDGQYIYTWAEEMDYWNPRNGFIERKYPYSYRGFNRNGHYAWTGGRVPGRNLVADKYDEGTLRLWDTSNNSLFRRVVTGFNWNKDEVRALDFSPNGKYILIAVDTYEQHENGDYYVSGQRLVLLDFATSRVIRTFSDSEIASVESLYFLNDNQTVLSITPDHRVILWDINTGELIREIGISNQPMTFLGVSPDEHYVMMRTVENDLRVWEITRSNRQIIQQLPVQNVRDLSFSPDGKTIYTIFDAFVGSYNIATKEQNYRNYAGNPIISADFHPHDSTALVNIEYWGNVGRATGGLVLQFDMKTGDYQTLDYLGNRICNLNYSDDGRFLMLDGIYQGIVSQSQIADIFPTTLRDELNQEKWTDYCPQPYLVQAMSPSTRYLAVLNTHDLSNDMQAGLAIYDSSTGRKLHQLSGFFNLPRAIKFSPDSKMLFAAADNVVLLYSVETGEVLRRYIGHTDTVNDIDVSSDGRYLISASEDGSVILWDIASGQIVRRYLGHENGVKHVVFNADATRAASSDGSEIIVWRIEDFTNLLTWLKENRYIPALTCTERSQYNIRPLCSGQTPTATPVPIAAPTATPYQQVEIIVQSANLRSTPSQQGAIIANVPLGDVLVVLERNLDWFRVSLPDGTEGWINRDLAQWR